MFRSTGTDDKGKRIRLNIELPNEEAAKAGESGESSVDNEV